MIGNLLMKHLLCIDLILQNKYKQSGKTSMSSSLYAHLPQTAETQLAAKMSDLQSEVTNACKRESRLTTNRSGFLSVFCVSLLSRINTRRTG